MCVCNGGSPSLCAFNAPRANRRTRSYAQETADTMSDETKIIDEYRSGEGEEEE